MPQRKFDTGMYIVDEHYTIVNFNDAMNALYPDVKVGDICYRAIALRDAPCSVCPLRMDNALFFNPIRKEWIYANAAAMNYPGHGECYTVQFQLRQRVIGAAQETLALENMDEHIAELNGGSMDACAIGGYCAPGSPLFYVNEQLLHLLGYNHLTEFHESIGGMVSNTIHPDDLDRVTKDLTRCAQHGGTFETTYRIHHKDDSWFWIVSRGKRVATQSGTYALLCVITDMRDFIRQQGQLHEENIKLLQKELTSQAVLAHMPGGYHRCADAPGFPFLYIGHSFEKITGWTRQEIETEFDNLFINMVVPEDVPLCAGIISNIEKSGYGNDIYRIKRKGGGCMWVSDSTMRVDFGGEIFYHGTLADVTDYIEIREKAQRGLELAKQAAEDSNHAKSAFLFNVSHDIRTPMNAIQGFAHIIGANADNPAIVRDAVEKMKKSSAVLLQLLNDVLELSRIESGKDKPVLQPLDLNAFTEKLQLMFAGEIASAGLAFQIETDFSHPYVLCDELKCTRILMNMLGNAKKFTPVGGQVTLGIRELSSNDHQSQYRLYVRDTGIGMSEEFQKRAFDEFERAKTSTDSGKTGSGLGLAIIKRLVETMGGACELKSEVNKGTEIAAVLPLSHTSASLFQHKEADATQVNFSGKRILLVEDNDFNREIARYVFEELGVIVDEAENGRVCIDKLTSAPPRSYDLILMDIQMPVLDGYAATQEIRRHPDPAIAAIPIIAMTANAFSEDKEKCLAIGMNGHLGKPFVAEDVFKELSKVLI